MHHVEAEAAGGRRDSVGVGGTVGSLLRRLLRRRRRRAPSAAPSAMRVSACRIAAPSTTHTSCASSGASAPASGAWSPPSRTRRRKSLRNRYPAGRAAGSGRGASPPPRRPSAGRASRSAALARESSTIDAHVSCHLARCHTRHVASFRRRRSCGSCDETSTRARLPPNSSEAGDDRLVLDGVERARRVHESAADGEEAPLHAICSCNGGARCPTPPSTAARWRVPCATPSPEHGMSQSTRSKRHGAEMPSAPGAPRAAAARRD